ncbi:MAG: hypothetical protein IIB28_07465 [Chloroflexi bacterium]|nr:hypothetical protein [Chloroflexota bacterium]
MAIIQRRVFYGKVGTAGRLVEWAQEMYGLIAEQDQNMTIRIMTDHQSGRTDRMVVELEAESGAALDAIIEKTMADLSLQPKFQAAFEKLPGLIDHAEVEQWDLH